MVSSLIIMVSASRLCQTWKPFVTRDWIRGRFYIRALQQIRGQTAQAADLKADINSTGTQTSLPMDPSSLCSQGVTQSEAGHGNGGLNQGGSGLPLECSGIDQVRPSLGSQLQKPFVQTPNQFQLLSQQQQQRQFLQAQARGSSIQAGSPKVRVDSQDQEELTMKLLSLQQLLSPLPWQLCLPWQPPPLLSEPLSPSSPQQLQLRGSSIQASSPKVRVDSQDQEELIMDVSIAGSLPTNPSHSQGVTQSKSGLVNGGGSSFDDINDIESLEIRSKCKEKLWSNTSSPVDNDFDQSHEMGGDEINLIGSQTPKVKSKRKRKCKSSVWQSFKRITERDGKERAQCKRCDKKYLIDSRTIGTSTLSRHEQKCSGQLEPKDQGPEPIQEENIIEARTTERPCVLQAHISPAVQRWTLSTPASGVLGTTPAVTTKRRQLAEMHTESDKPIWSKTSAFPPTSHYSANKSAGTEADEGKSPVATEEEVLAPRDLQLSLATTKSGPQEESGSVHKQFGSAEELRSIAEPKKALKITLNGILDGLWKGQIECLGRYESAVDLVLRSFGSAVDVLPLEAIFTELFTSLKEWQSIQDPASLYLNEVVDRVAILRRELNEVRELANEEKSLLIARSEQMHLYKQKSQKHKDIILSSLYKLEVLDQAMLDLDEVRELEIEEHSSWIDRCRRQMLLDMDRSLERNNILLTEAAERVSRFEARVVSKDDELKAFNSMVEGILGVGLESMNPVVAAQRYAAHKRGAMEAQLQDFPGKINDFFKE
ncbi:hypothetical protein CKAN_02597200 [Cinnamomum micranthum f. kanehirae]|uniref:BED-type domain-containing protein n=1 Tax=Cinnamomum micranthum f. kanehirae TaxID=337451 RepID=A0A443Q0S1_9MAGN|nr:hypothetical protein CKAN_02597200 [Cinnamomum micranthum f. kanehirae]